MRVFFRKKPGESPLLDKRTDTVKTENLKFSINTALNNATTKLSGSEDAIEVLMEKKKNSITAETLTKPDVTDIPTGVKIAGQRNVPTMVKEEKTFQPVIQGEALVTPGKQLKRKEHNKPNALPVLKKPVAVSHKNTSITEEPKEITMPNTLRELVFANQKAVPLEDKHREATMSTVSKKPGTFTQNPPSVKEQKESTISSTPEHAITEQIIAPAGTKQQESPKSDLITELKTNLAVASRPWAEKLIPFQTKYWDTNHSDSESMLTSYHQELMQLRVDIGLANNIVWLAEITGHRSKELDESYIKLCADIAANIRLILKE
jgi:hypothetical protein